MAIGNLIIGTVEKINQRHYIETLTNELYQIVSLHEAEEVPLSDGDLGRIAYGIVYCSTLVDEVRITTQSDDEGNQELERKIEYVLNRLYSGLEVA